MRSSSAPTLPPKNWRSRVGSGQALFLDRAVDERSGIAKRFREVFAQIVADIGGDPSEAQIQIARRAATLAVWAESLEAKLAMGADLDVATYTTASNSLRRLLSDLGLERKAKDITHDLGSLLAAHKNAAPAHPLATDITDLEEEPDIDDPDAEEADNFADEPEGSE